MLAGMTAGFHGEPGLPEVKEPRTRTLDRAKRPRAPRGRAGKRRMAALGFEPRPVADESLPLTEDEHAVIMAPLALGRFDPGIAARLEELKADYRRWRQQPPASREEAAYELAMIAHLAWKRKQAGVDVRAIEAALRRLVDRPNDHAQALLWAAWLRHPPPTGPDLRCYLEGETIDWDLVGEAAATAWGDTHGGDIRDPTLELAIQLLVELFEATGRTATWSRRTEGPISGDGELRQLAGSACGRFVVAFFAVVDPGVSETHASNLLRRLLHHGRKRRG